MTKYSIKIRRNKLTKGRIESHKDFRALQQMSARNQSSGSVAKLIVIVIATIIFIAMIFFGIQKVGKSPVQQEPVEETDIFDEFKN